MAKLLIVGEAPPDAEKRGPFTNRAGKAFRKAMAAVNIDPDRADFAYPATAAEIDESGSEYVVLAGNKMLHLFRPDLDAGHCHGRVMKSLRGMILFPVFHHEVYTRTKLWSVVLADELKILRRIAVDVENWATYTTQSCVHCRGKAYRVDEANVVYCEEHWDD